MLEPSLVAAGSVRLEKVRHSEQTVRCVKAQGCQTAKAFRELKHFIMAGTRAGMRWERSSETGRGFAAKSYVCHVRETGSQDFIQEVMWSHRRILSEKQRCQSKSVFQKDQYKQYQRIIGSGRQIRLQERNM